MKKKIAIILAVVMAFCSGCGIPNGSVTNLETQVQYVISMNPSVMTADGTVMSIRNAAASAMQADIKANSTTYFYNSTPWQWVTHDVENGQWQQRAIRNLTSWSDGVGNTKKNAPYSYKFSDELSMSLSVYDSSKMDIKGADDNLNTSGIIFSFTGEKEEGICYTASEDCYIELSDRDAGSISIVQSIVGMNTSFLKQEDAKGSVLLRIYKNNRIYWQEILNADVTSVSFPEFSGIDMLAGDSIMITAQATDDVGNITLGNCDLPATTEEITVKKPIYAQVLVEEPLPDAIDIPLVKDMSANFTVIRPDECDSSTKDIIDGFVSTIETKLDIYPEYLSDYELEEDPTQFYILIGKTELEESKNALEQIKSIRKANAADFIIRQIKNKVVITADNDYSLGYAIDFFFSNYCKDEESVIEAGLDYVSSKYNPVRDVLLGNTSITDYRVVHSPYYTFMEAQAVDYLISNVTKLTGYIIEAVDDTATVSSHEILIGDTKRTSNNYSTTADTVGGNGYTISVGKNTTSVLSNSNSAVNAGTVDLVSRLKSGNVAAGTYNGTYDGNYSLANGWKLAWSEDFNGDKLSKTWKFKDADGYDTMHGGKTIGTMDNCEVKDGALNAHVYLKDDDIYGVTMGTTGVNSMAFKYGYLEGRIKLSTASGYSGALWAVTYSGTLGSGEFDVFENAGKLDVVAPNLHSWASTGHTNILGGVDSVANYASPKLSIGENFGLRYHNFGMEWTDDVIKFYIDGKCRYTVDCTTSPMFDIFDEYINVNMCFFGDEVWTKMRVSDSTPTSISYVDWVRVWQKDELGYGIRIK